MIVCYYRDFGWNCISFFDKEYVTRSKRSDAKAAFAEAQMAEEKYSANHVANGTA